MEVETEGLIRWEQTAQTKIMKGREETGRARWRDGEGKENSEGLEEIWAWLLAEGVEKKESKGDT